jgi:hypothetical protein
MKAIMKLYCETGSREDWETRYDAVIELPKGTDLGTYGNKLTEELNKLIVSSGIHDEYGQWYVVIDPYAGVLKGADIVASLLKAVKRNNPEAGY